MIDASLRFRPFQEFFSCCALGFQGQSSRFPRLCITNAARVMYTCVRLDIAVKILLRRGYRLLNAETSINLYTKVFRGARALAGLPVIAALGLGTLPARALPVASVEIIHVGGDGVQAMPAIGKAFAQLRLQSHDLAKASQAPQAASSPLKPELQSDLAQSDLALKSSLSSYTQTFLSPLPGNLSGKLRLVSIDPGTDSIGQVLEEIPLDGPSVVISPDRLQLTVKPQLSSVIQPGQIVMLQLPSMTLAGDPIVYPYHLATTPCKFPIAAASPTPTLAAAAPAVSATISPWVIVGGVAVLGLIVAAAAGAFNGGGGGTNQVSQ
ncbi:MAG: hypothetical protein WAM11_10935 [Cyanobium sp.]